jgi:hypothetical protein
VRAGAADGWGRAAARERGCVARAWARADGPRGPRAEGGECRREGEREGGKLGPDTAQPRGGRRDFPFFSFSIFFSLIPFLL